MNAIVFKGEFQKVDEEQWIVSGFASVIQENGEDVVDAHGDVIKERTLVEAAHQFMVDHRLAKAMHEGGGIGEVVESIVFTLDVQKALGIDLGKVGWWVSIKIYSYEVWKRVKNGELRAFSIGGRAERKELE